MNTLLAQLRVWRRREWLFDATWAAARWVVVVVVVLAFACLTDWLIDRFAEGAIYATGRWLRAPNMADQVAAVFAGTPLLLRVVLTLAQS